MFIHAERSILDPVSGPGQNSKDFHYAKIPVGGACPPIS